MSDQSSEKICQELLRLQPIIERIVGVPSRWNGRVEIVETTEFNGKKPFACHILLNRRLVDSNLRWRTLIHELFHSVSAGYNSSDYNEYLGWEEGVVEMLQRLYRQEMLSQLNVPMDDAGAMTWEAELTYNRFLHALEKMRNLLGVDKNQFYCDLLNTPIRERIAFVFGLAQGLSPDQRRSFITTFSAANGVLTRGIR